MYCCQLFISWYIAEVWITFLTVYVEHVSCITHYFMILFRLRFFVSLLMLKMLKLSNATWP